MAHSDCQTIEETQGSSLVVNGEVSGGEIEFGALGAVDFHYLQSSQSTTLVLSSRRLTLSNEGSCCCP